MPLNSWLRPRVRSHKAAASRAVLGCSAVGLALAWLLQACAPSVEQQASDERSFLSAPSRTDFPEVGTSLELRCGTLDCHGQPGRSLRLYGYGGQRLSPTDTPNGSPTSDQEIAACYDSVVGLEPEVISEVVTHRADPDQLTLVRKMRGVERHKGGQQSSPGDDLDRCVVLWLTAMYDQASCDAVINAPTPSNN
jgi:hypothetical protein